MKKQVLILAVILLIAGLLCGCEVITGSDMIKLLPFGIFLSMLITGEVEEDDIVISEEGQLEINNLNKLIQEPDRDSGAEKDKPGKGDGDQLEIEGVPPEFIKQHSGKDTKQLIKQLHADQEMINRQSGELGDLRKKTNVSTVSKDSAQEKYKAKTGMLSSLEKQLENLDDVIDAEKAATIRQQIASTKGELSALEEESFNERVNRQVFMNQNKDSAAEIRNKLVEDYGIQLSDTDWEAISENAIANAGNSKVTRNQVLAELMRNNPETESLLLAHGSQKARDSIVTASQRKTPPLTGISKKAGDRVKLSELDPDTRKRVLSNLADGTLDALIEKMLKETDK